MSEKTILEGPTVGTLFSNAVSEIRRSMMPVGLSSAVDLKMSFKSIQLSKDGWSCIFVKTSETTSSMEIELSTRIHTDDLARPLESELVSFVQSQAAAAGFYKGPVDGIRSAALDESIKKALDDKITNAGPTLIAALRINADDRKDSDKRFVAYLQICIGESAYPVDGELGSNTEFAFAMRRKGYLGS